MEEEDKKYPYYFTTDGVEFVTYELYNGIKCTMAVEDARLPL